MRREGNTGLGAAIARQTYYWSTIWGAADLRRSGVPAVWSVGVLSLIKLTSCG